MLIRLEPSFIACKWVPTSTRDCTGLYIYLHSTSNYCLLRETFFFPANIKQRDRLGHKLFSVPVNQCFFTRIRKEGRKEENNWVSCPLSLRTSCQCCLKGNLYAQILCQIELFFCLFSLASDQPLFSNCLHFYVLKCNTSLLHLFKPLQRKDVSPWVNLSDSPPTTHLCRRFGIPFLPLDHQFAWLNKLNPCKILHLPDYPSCPSLLLFAPSLLSIMCYNFVP